MVSQQTVVPHTFPRYKSPMTEQSNAPTPCQLEDSAATTAPLDCASPRDESQLELEPMDPHLTDIQPGGGVVIQLEKLWGRWRRWWLKTMRPSYVERMLASRRGDVNGCPHEVLDPRDLKYYRNQPNYWWSPEDDPFRWRDSIPFARAGLAELLVFSLITFGPAAGIVWSIRTFEWTGASAVFGWLSALALAVIGILIVWFFRDPPRSIPQGEGLVVSPADGTVSCVEDVEYDEFIDGPAVLVGIFLSIFNVHINRTPISARVIGLRYKPGKYLNAMRPESARENEQVAVRIEGTETPCRRMVVRQITGAIARRIVCWVKPGDVMSRGDQFGMIKLGSRTELVLPKEAGLEIAVAVGDKLKAGKTLLARYTASVATRNGPEQNASGNDAIKDNTIETASSDAEPVL